jgi:hypothetical protein
VRLRHIILAGAAVLIAAVFAAPFAPAIRIAFSAVCHQLPERSFLWLGGPMPVCARCLGLYAGLLAVAVRPIRVPAAAVWVLAALNGLDWLSGIAPNGPRFVLAFVFCWAAAAPLAAFASRERTASN